MTRGGLNRSDHESSRLLVLSDDWGRHPSSCQHLIRCLLPTHEVKWVNTIGMRPPRLDRITLSRGLAKIQSWTTGSDGSRADAAEKNPAHDSGESNSVCPREVGGLDAASPEILSPIMWPWMSHRWDRWLNRRLLTRQLRHASLDAIAITTIPIVADLTSSLPVKRWVYYCVDDFSVWPGLDGKTLGRMEDDLLPGMNRIVAASDTLAEGIRRRGFDCEVLTHGVDLDFWSSNQSVQSSANTELGQAERSSSEDENSRVLVLFWGVVDQRMNAGWLLDLADQMPDGEIRLVGPQENPDERLRKHPRISMPGPVNFEALPMLASTASVLVMPYANLSVTRAMQPLKLKEYLSTGKSVVCAELPSTIPWADCLDIAKTSQEFVARVKERIQSGILESQRTARHRLQSESWAAKADTLKQIIRC